MVVRRIELKKTVEKLPEIILRVYLILQYHLQHRVPEVQVWIIRVLLHRHASPVVAELRRGLRVAWRERGSGGGVGGAAARRGVVPMKPVGLVRGLLGPPLRVEYVPEEPGPSAAAAAQAHGHGIQNQFFSGTRHCCC